ncbi:MAG: sigma-70 family RNA polymerase sigma factor [Phycisphaerales bacterium]|nr:sigma-70 family RNA polymerase sigma factor [Phycisphaerales bacterium]
MAESVEVVRARRDERVEWWSSTRCRHEDELVLDLTRTSTLFLTGLQDPGNESQWATLDERYRPIIIAFARRLGLSDADAADVGQETMMQVLKECREGKYDRSRGRFRAWLITIARYRVAAVYRTKSRKREYRGESAMIDLENDDQIHEIWDHERRARILRQALEELRTRTRTNDRTIRAFELHVVRQMPVKAVAEELGITEHDVYQAKSRIASQLRDIIADLDKAYDEAAA